MSGICQVAYIRPVFMVEKLSRFSNAPGYTNYVFVFVGEQEREMREKIEGKYWKNDKKKSSNYKEIVRRFGEDLIKKWNKLSDKKKELVFIYNWIMLNDNLNTLKKKIFLYCSNPEKKQYMIPQNQELWIQVKDEKSKYKMLGYKFIDKNSGLTLDVKPHIYDNIEIDNDFLMQNEIMQMNNNEVNNSQKDLLKKDYRIEADENYYLLYDLFDNENVVSNTIYVSDVMEEFLFLLKTGKWSKTDKVKNEQLEKGYLRRYWPNFNLETPRRLDKMQILMNEVKKIYDKENYIIKLMDNLVIEDGIFQDCSITTVKFNINSDTNTNLLNDDEEDYGNEDIDLMVNPGEKEVEFVDLYQIFDYLREKRIGDDIPFIKYGEVTIDDPFMVISLQAVNDNRVSKKFLMEWVGLGKDDERRYNGLQIKKFLKVINEEYKYITIKLSRNGRVTMNFSFKEDDHANLSDIVLAVKKCKDIIDDINKNIPDYRLIRVLPENKRIKSPDMVFEDGIIKYKSNTKLTFMNMMIGLSLPKSLDFKRLKEYIKLYPTYLSEDLDDIQTTNSLKLRYNRVSSYANMDKIMAFIDEIYNKGQSDAIIEKLVMDKFEKKLEEAKEYIKDYKKNIVKMGKGKIDTEFKRGIKISIFQNKILLNGITNIYQIPELYKFFTMIIYTFLNEEKIMRNNRNYEKYIYARESKRSELEILERKEDEDIGDLGLYAAESVPTTSDDFLNDELIDIRNPVYSKMMEVEDDDINTENDRLKSIITKRGTILASEDLIDPNIRLDCDDAVVELQTCEDFCNDPRYFIRRLQYYDNTLFKFNVSKQKGEKQYSRSCQGSDNQPVILDYNPDTHPRIKRESYSYSIQYSSDPQTKKMWYVCPKIWCPYCEIPISENDIDRKTINRKKMKGEKKLCITALCPYGDHQVFVRDDKIMSYEQDKKFKEELKRMKSDKEREEYIKQIEEENKFPAYPGFAAQKHPKGFCLPCCFSKNHSLKGSSYYSSFLRCLGEEVEEENKQDGQVYIKKSFPVDNNRYGILPTHVGKVLNSTIESGVLKDRSGYFRKGIKHIKDSFLSCIADILSCDRKVNVLTVEKIKKTIIEKLDERLFRSLHSGNLMHIFTDPNKSTSALENFEYYLINSKMDIGYQYLWDLLQRPNVLFENGLNIFIFEDNHLVCPKGENISEFYKKYRRSILIAKHNQFYEPIYYLEGSRDGKIVQQKCIYDSSRPEISNLFNILEDGCTEKPVIKWDLVLNDVKKKYSLNFNSQKLDLGISLEKTLEKILLSIKDGSLNKNFMPMKQYVDGYNKVYAIELKNKLFVPVGPSKIMVKLPYEILIDLNERTYLNFEDTVKLMNELSTKTGLDLKVYKKILDKRKSENETDIVAVLLENDRVIPVKKSKNRDNKMGVSQQQYFSDIDYYIHNKMDYIPDMRVEIMNRNNYEEESYQRLRFEISRYIQLKENRKYKHELEEIINMETKDIVRKKTLIKKLIMDLIKKIVYVGKKNMDINSYRRPNKRVPCFQRSIKEKRSKNESNNNNQFKLGCSDDPHCIKVKGKCMLYINEKNLLNNKRENLPFYVDKIVEEILRYPMKRNEILYDNISPIINKEEVILNPNRYILIHGESPMEVLRIIQGIYMDKSGLILDTRPTYEEFTTQDFTFIKEQYLKSNAKVVNKSLIEDLPINWQNYLGTSFKVEKNRDDSIFIFMGQVLKEMNMEGLKNIQVDTLKNYLIEQLKKIVEEKQLVKQIYEVFNPKEKTDKKMNKTNNTKLKYDENTIVELYRRQCNKIMGNIQTFSQLIMEIQNDKYGGCDVDLVLFSTIFSLNMIILDKRFKTGQSSYYCIGPTFGRFVRYIILLRSVSIGNIYSIVQSKNKYLFEDVDLPHRFKEDIVDNCDKNCLLRGLA